MKFLRIILYPFSQLYGLLVALRNKCYDLGFFSSREFNLPVISVGNLTLGGTGKTPHIEYIIRLLKETHKIATLSRGYGRITSGFQMADERSTSADVGDEPKQFKRKFPDVEVAVDARRVRGIRRLLEKFPSLDLVLLDDAFQHRAVKPGLSVLLTDYTKLYYTDTMVPSGTLREWHSGVKRADIIVVTKTPALFSPLEKKRIIKDIRPLPYQHIYFSYLRYGDFVPMNNEEGSRQVLSREACFDQGYTVVMLTGIANAWHLEYFLKEKVKKLITVKFSDHHEYSLSEVMRLRDTFQELKGENKIILTTEKDAMRLDKAALIEILRTLPVYYVPIEIAFHDRDEQEFNQQIVDYVRANPYANNSH